MQTTTAREDLEKLARETCSPELYYDLVNAIDDMEDKDLQHIVDCGGNFYREIKDNPTFDDESKAEALAEYGE